MFRTILATIGSTANTIKQPLYTMWHEDTEAELWSQKRRPLVGHGPVNTFLRQPLYMLWHEDTEAELWSQKRRPLLGHGPVNTFLRQPSRMTAGAVSRVSWQSWAVSSQSESEAVVRQSPPGEGVGRCRVPIVGSRSVATPSRVVRQ
jgi:hypothetical protein